MATNYLPSSQKAHRKAKRSLPVRKREEVQKVLHKRSRFSGGAISMSERAKQVALKIIATAWPGCLVTQGMIDDTAAAVEKHLLRPHQVRDHVGIIWEQMSDGCYRTLNGAKTDYIDRNFGPLTEVQGEPMPDAGEIERLKKRYYEMSQEIESLNALSPEKASLMSKIDSLEREKQADSIVISTNRRERDDMVNRIVELERQLAEAKAEPAKPTALQEFVDMCRAVVARFGMEGEVPCKWSFILNSAGPFPAI
jgi:hypothetical protein